MNAPYQPDPNKAIVEDILADACVGISTLKKNPAAVIAEARVRQVAILNRNKPVAYLVAPHVWERLTELVEEMADIELAKARRAEKDKAVPVTLDDLLQA